MNPAAPSRLLLAAAGELGQAAAAWRGLGSATTRAFLVQDLRAIARPCAPLLLLFAFFVAGLGLSYLLRALVAVNAQIAAEAARALLVQGGPLVGALLIVAVVLPLRVAALRAAGERGDYAGTVALGVPLARVLGLPWIGAHAVAAALAALAWLLSGMLLAPSLNALLGTARWLDQAQFLLLAISPLDPWMALLHGAWLGAVVGACGLASARQVRPAATALEDAATGGARAITRSLLLAVLGLAAAETLWWLLRWLLAGG